MLQGKTLILSMALMGMAVPSWAREEPIVPDLVNGDLGLIRKGMSSSSSPGQRLRSRIPNRPGLFM